MSTRTMVSSAKVYGYRYGFQNQEKDDEIKGKGNSVNYQYRMHDTRLGRFFAVDPLTSDYPMLTPYQFSSNSPIYLIEMEGLEGTVYQYKQWYDKDGNIRKEPMGQYEVTGLFADVNKILWKEYNNPNSETIRYDYLVRMPNGESGGGIKNVTPSDKPNSAQEVNTALGLTKPKPESKPIEKSMFSYGGGGPIELLFGKAAAEKVRVSEAKMEGGKAPLPIRLLVKVLPGTSMVDAGVTLFTGKDMMSPERGKVTGAWDRVISPIITIGTGGLSGSGVLKTGSTLYKANDKINKLNTGYGVAKEVLDSL